MVPGACGTADPTPAQRTTAAPRLGQERRPVGLGTRRLVTPLCGPGRTPGSRGRVWGRGWRGVCGCPPVQLSPQRLVLARGDGVRPLLLLQRLPLRCQHALQLAQLRLLLQQVPVPVRGKPRRVGPALGWQLTPDSTSENGVPPEASVQDRGTGWGQATGQRTGQGPALPPKLSPSMSHSPASCESTPPSGQHEGDTLNSTPSSFRELWISYEVAQKARTHLEETTRYTTPLHHT